MPPPTFGIEVSVLFPFVLFVVSYLAKEIEAFII